MCTHSNTWIIVNFIMCSSEDSFIIKGITLYAYNVRWTVNEPTIFSSKCSKSLTNRYGLNINDDYTFLVDY